jgi:hypothetical protein
MCARAQGCAANGSAFSFAALSSMQLNEGEK